MLSTKQVVCGGDLKTIVLQDENGPCPLLAIVNSLVLLGGLTLEGPRDFDQLIENLGAVGGHDLKPYRTQLVEGLDANPVFDGTFDGETTQLFGLFGLQLVHGWVIPDSPETSIAAARRLSYDTLTVQLTTDTPDASVLWGQQFIETYPSQISPAGLDALKSTMQDGDVAILFRNNHYSTIVRHGDLILMLVTDEGFASYGDIVWETLAVSGEGQFYEGNYQQRLDCSRDAEIARELQEQEDQLRGESQMPRQEGSQRQLREQPQQQLFMPPQAMEVQPLAQETHEQEVQQEQAPPLQYAPSERRDKLGKPPGKPKKPTCTIG